MADTDKILTPEDAILVSDSSMASAETYDVLNSNISVVNALMGEHLRETEISRAALKSYYVDYYLGQVNNGGFSQFVFNTGWNAFVVELVREGLRDMGATQRLALFVEGVAAVETLGGDKLKRYLGGDYFGEDPDRDALGSTDDRFFALNKTEDLIALNAAWLRRQPTLRALPVSDLEKEVERRGAALPDRPARIEAAKQARPRYVKLIDALCAKAGQTLQRVTAGDPTLGYDGVAVRQLSDKELENPSHGAAEIVWFFITDKGLHLMAEHGGKAAMFDDKTRKKVAEIDAP